MKFIVMQANNFGVHTKVAQIYEYNAGPRGKGVGALAACNKVQPNCQKM